MKYKKQESIITAVPEEMIDEEYFSVISLKRAVWQYLIDHSRTVDDEGLVKFNFFVYSENDFWKRVNARDRGIYHRTDIVKFHEKALRKNQAVKVLRIKANQYDKQKKYSDWFSKSVIEKIEKGNLYERLVLKINSRLNKYVKSKIIPNKKQQ